MARRYGEQRLMLGGKSVPRKDIAKTRDVGSHKIHFHLMRGFISLD